MVVGVEAPAKSRIRTGLEQSGQQFVLLGFVNSGLRKLLWIILRQPHTEAEGLDAVVAIARLPGIVVDLRQQTARWISDDAVGINARRPVVSTLIGSTNAVVDSP